MLRCDQRPHVRRPVGRGPDLQRLDLRHELLDQRVRRRLADRHRHRDRHAALAGRAVGRAHQRAHRHVDVGVGQDDRVVLGAAERLNPLPVRRAGGIDVARDRRRADEAHRLYVWVRQQRVHRLLVAVDHVEDAIRHACLRQQLGDEERRGRVALGRLQDEGVAAGERHREHPHRHHAGEVEWRDAGDHAERLAQRVAVDVGADVLGDLALQQVRDADGELDDLEAAGDLAQGVVVGLAVLGRDQLGDLVGILHKQELEAVEDARAAQRRGLRPSRPGGLRHRHDIADLLGRGERHPLLGGTGRRVEDVGEPAGLARHAPAKDVVAEIGHRLVPCSLLRATPTGTRNEAHASRFMIHSTSGAGTKRQLRRGPAMTLR